MMRQTTRSETPDRAAVLQKTEEILGALGLESLEDMRYLTRLCVEKTADKLSAAVGLSGTDPVPDSLRTAAAIMAAGELLFVAKASGRLVGFDFEAAVSGVRLGDVDVQFLQPDETTPEARFDRLVEQMRTLDGEGLVRYRKLCW